MKNLSSQGASQPGSVNARRAEAHRQAGLQAQRARRWDAAAQEFEHAVDLTPADWLMWVNLARSRMELGQHAGALEAAQRSFELDRTNIVACRMAAELQLQMARHSDALRTLQALSEDAPRDHDYYNALGNALFQTRDPRNAVDAFFKALTLKVDSAIVHYRLGLCFMDMAMDLEAAECFRTAISLDAGSTGALALSLLVQENRQACNWKDDAADTRALLEAVDRDDPETARLLLPFALIAIESTPAQQRRLGERRIDGMTRHIVPLPPAGPRKPGRIRVGYLSSDFYHHATAVLMTELLERRDTTRFETFLYSHSRDDDSPIARRVRAAAEHYVDIRDTGNCAVARRMREDGIDILIDL